MSADQRKLDQQQWMQRIASLEIGEVITSNSQKILKSLEPNDVDIAEVSRLLALEPALIAKLLMITNSPFYGFPREIKDIEEAIVVLGASKLKSLVYSSLVLIPDSQLKQKQYIQHSLATAMYAKALAQKLGKPPEIPFIGALLHTLPVIVGYQDGIEHLLSMEVLKESASMLLRRLKLPQAAEDAVIGLYSATASETNALCIRMAFNLSTIALGKANAPFVHLINTEFDFQKLNLSPKEVAKLFFEHKTELKNLLALAG